MEQKYLDELIVQLESKASNDEGMFGIYEDRDVEPGCFIKADKEGLVLFALELLKTARKFEHTVDSEVSIISLAQHHKWIVENSEILIRYVKQIRPNSFVSEPIKRRDTLADKLVPAGQGHQLFYCI